MKKLCILLLCLTMLLVSCNQPQKADEFETDIPSAPTAESTAVSSEEESSIAAPPDPTFTTVHGEPPERLTFGSYDEVRKFITAVRASEQDFEKYVEEDNEKPYLETTIHISISYGEAQDAASALASVSFPIVSQDLEFSLSITYTYDQYHDQYHGGWFRWDWLSVVYTVEGIRYRSDYLLDCSPEMVAFYQKIWNEKLGSTPDLSNVLIGEDTVDLYKGTEGFNGLYKSGSTLVVLSINTTQPELVKLNSFQFSKLFQ